MASQKLDPDVIALAGQLREALKAEFGVDLPEDLGEFIQGARDMWESFPASDREKALLIGRGISARENDTPDGFADFFWCCTRMELPAHALYGWIVPIYFSHREFDLETFKAFYDRPAAARYRFIRDYVVEQIAKKRVNMDIVLGIVIEASRELTKTTVITNYFMAFRIGHAPYTANLLIQVGDDIAKDNSAVVAGIIERFEGWKACFPHVVPDIPKGWGADGYEVRQTHTWNRETKQLEALTDEEWNQKNALRHDPSLLGLGYSSHALIGKHPNGMLAVDDIHDENNTASDKEMEGVLSVVESTINYLPTANCWIVYVGTPWSEGDTLHYIKNTGSYISVVMPAYVEIGPDGNIRLPEQWLEDTQKIYMWDELRGEEWVRRKLSQTRKIREFLRMVLLVLKGAWENIYKYKSYPAKEIKKDEWEMIIGLDPTATFTSVSGKGAGVSHFAMCHAYETPYRTLVIGGGYLKKVGADIGERELAKTVHNHPNFSRASVEDDGAGAVFIGFVSRNTGIKINNHSAGELSKKHTKKARQFDFLSPYLAAGIVLISDDPDDEYLIALRKYFDLYPQIADNSELLDAADALCYAVLDCPEIWANAITNVIDPAVLQQKREMSKGRAVPKLGGYHFGG